MKDHISYPENIKQEFVDIPQAVVTFFQQRNQYIRLPRKGKNGIAVTYASVQGKNATEVPREYFNDDYLMQTTEEYPLTNTEEASKREADSSTIEAIKFIFGSGSYGNIEKSYMINTSTMPIKIKFSEKGKKSKKTIYVKRPDTNRIVGHYFYSITSGIQEIKYGFNRAVFVEEGIHGNTLSKLDERIYLLSQEYKEGLVRATVQADLLGLYRDVQNPRNRIVDSKMRTVLFDFNLIFKQRKPDEVNILLEKYLQRKDFMDNNNRLIEIYKEEQHNIVRRLEERHKCFFKFVKLVGNLADFTGRSIDERIRLFYGAKNLENYFERKIEEYRLV